MLGKSERKESGFTLIEMAVVLVIIGLLLGSFIGSFADRIDATRRDNTKKELDDVTSILLAFAYTKSPPYLPCPDSKAIPDGVEDVRVAGVCPQRFGHLPWKTLGVGYSDSWGNRYKYWASKQYTNSSGFVLATDIAEAESATIRDRIGTITPEVLNNAVVVVFSHGKNGLGAHSVAGVNREAIPSGASHKDERQNVQNESVLYSRVLRTENTTVSVGGLFDDIVVWISSYELKAKMVEAGVLP